MHNPGPAAVEPRQRRPLTSESPRARRFALPEMHDPRTDEAIDALLAGRARHRGRPVTALVPTENGRPFDGLESRVAWNQALERENARQQRYSRATSIVAFGVQVLSEAGRAQGWQERVASPIAHAIRRGARDTDLVTRAGPGLFEVLLPETTESEAVAFADRIVSDCRIWLDAVAAPVAVRAAVAGTTGDIDLAETLERAVALIEGSPRPAAQRRYQPESDQEPAELDRPR